MEYAAKGNLNTVIQVSKHCTQAKPSRRPSISCAT
jgi:hypothetical protein